MQVERRRDPRLAIRCPIRFRAPGTGVQGRSVTENVSARGAYFRTIAWRELDLEEALEVSLAVPRAASFDGPIDLSGRGRVVRIEAPDDDDDLVAAGVALEFDSPLDLAHV